MTEQPDNKTKEMLLLAARAGNFLEAVYAASMEDPDERSDLHLKVAELHNQGLVDVVAAFEGLKSKSVSGPDFFLTRHLFEKALPHINAPVAPVMRCVVQLYKDAGADMSAGMIINSFVEFCSANTDRPAQAVKEIEGDPSGLIDLLPGSLSAGSRFDSSHYLTEAIRLARSDNVELRRRAVFSVGQLKWPDDKTPPEAALEALQQAAADESDDELLAAVVKSAFYLLQRDKAQELRVALLLESALSKGGDSTLNAASQIFGFATKDIPDSILTVLLPHLRRIKVEHTGTIRFLDYGIAYLLKEANADQGLELLQDLLLTYPNDLDLQNFSSSLTAIRKNKALASKVLTRWFLRGDIALGEVVESIVGASHDKPMEIEIDAAEMGEDSAKRVVFVARKALGHLLFRPVSAAGVLISLMRFTQSGETRDAVGELLFEPLLLNYTGSARAYVERQVGAETEAVKDALKVVLKRVEEYLDAIRSIGPIPEFHPGEAQRQTYRRNQSRLMAESMKQAEEQSPILSIISKSVLLYGRKSIHYAYGPDGQARRAETPLHSFGTEIEIPRYQHIDPFILDYMWRVLRSKEPLE